jgi:hypothetical protein
MRQLCVIFAHLLTQYKLAYAVFVIQGLGILLPWNAFISAADYFTDLYGASFVFFISLVYPKDKESMGNGFFILLLYLFIYF